MISVSSSSGFFGFNISRDAAKREVQAALGPGKLRTPASPHQKDPDFSLKTKKVLEVAQTVRVACSFIATICPDQYTLWHCVSLTHQLLLDKRCSLMQESRRSGMSTITVEHIVIALFANGSGCRGIMAR